VFVVQVWNEVLTYMSIGFSSNCTKYGELQGMSALFLFFFPPFLSLSLSLELASRFSFIVMPLDKRLEFAYI
jgi:hypothetical protein